MSVLLSTPDEPPRGGAEADGEDVVRATACHRR
jgi:hypothetical protein